MKISAGKTFPGSCWAVVSGDKIIVSDVPGTYGGGGGGAEPLYSSKDARVPTSPPAWRASAAWFPMGALRSGSDTYIIPGIVWDAFGDSGITLIADDVLIDRKPQLPQNIPCNLVPQPRQNVSTIGLEPGAGPGPRKPWVLPGCWG